VRLAGDERESTAHGSDSSGDGRSRSASELASQELRGELAYLTDEDEDDDGEIEGDGDDGDDDDKGDGDRRHGNASSAGNNGGLRLKGKKR